MIAHKSAPDELALLADISVRLGQNPAVVQGGGGNSSIKTDGGMWVKASGVCLRDVTRDKGFVAVDDAAIREGLSACRSEADYDALLSRCLHPRSKGRPSMETGFHALLGPVVLHTHPVSVNLLCCSVEGRDIARVLFPDVLWVPWAAPGLSLTQKIFSQITNKKPEIIFLQNHGLIVSGDTPAEAWQRHQYCCRTVAGHFQIPDNKLLQEGDVTADISHVLFPDQAVYLQNAGLSGTSAELETLQAYVSLRLLMAEKGLTPCYLPSAVAIALAGMDAEKFRRKIAGAAV